MRSGSVFTAALAFCFTGRVQQVEAKAVSEAGDNNRGPVVDLGYAVHKAKANDAEDYYTFNNIRYAEPPINENRFQPPRDVIKTDRKVNDGSVGFMCPQAIPKWALDQGLADPDAPQGMTKVASHDPPESEDCLFLDVVVPRGIFENQNNNGDSARAPVMVWLYGGGYVFGQKNDALYNPSGLMSQARSDGGDGMIYVAINYRLGLFGWLNGNGDDNVFPNVALQDQLFALKWVQSFIHLFGGDRNQVTVLGQSAGAGSITHHLTASKEDGNVPFHRAILQSPGWEHANSTDLWQKVLGTASIFSGQTVRTGKDLMSLDYEVLKDVNAYLVYNSPNGSFTFSPTPDRGYVPNFAERSLLDGHFDSKPHLMIGHNSNEAGSFVSPDIDTEEELRARLAPLFDNFRSESVDYLLDDLYPPPSDYTPYSTQSERAMLLVTESSFSCNTRFLAVAYANETHNYRFQVPPGTHGMDLPFTFYHDDATVASADLAQAMQLYFTSFVETGSGELGSVSSLVDWPEYGDKGELLTFGLDGVKTDEDAMVTARCEFWRNPEYIK